MVESPPQKRDEQYPLLMVTGGAGGDGGFRAVPPRAIPTVLSSVWNVSSCNPKRPWFDRLPEFISTCWMTFILLGISFLVFYAIGMVAYKQERFIIVKCNNSRPASEVFLHHIIPRDGYVPFTAYSDYLANLAVQYPYLRFNIFFLYDDSPQSAMSATKLPTFYSKLLPYQTSTFYSKLLPYQTTRLYDEYNKRGISSFEKRYQNVNVSVTTLSKYMAKTPLKYKWRTIPSAFLTFYARAFSVWQNGGVALDLSLYNRQHRKTRLDKRIKTILKEHNDGVNIESYTNAINRINHDDEKEFLAMFNNMIHNFLNETRSFFNRSLSYPIFNAENGLTEDEPLIRSPRNKRDNSDVTITNDSNNEIPVINLVLANTTVAVTDDAKENVYEIAVDTNMTSNGSKPINNNQVLPSEEESLKNIEADLSKLIKSPDNSMNQSTVRADHFVMIYDIAVISDGSFPDTQPLLLGGVQVEDGLTKRKSAGLQTQLVTIESDGFFISATSAQHPFLGHLISAGCKQMPPKLAIQDALLAQCSGMFRDDVYCDNIYIL